VHGWTADHRVWGPVARRLVDAGRRVVLYDQRGHGGSTAGSSGYTMEAIGDDVRAVLEGLDLHDVVLAGHSMGGMAVEGFAVRHKDVLAERVAALVLVSTLSRSVLPNHWAAEARYRMVTSPVTQRAVESRRAAPWLVRGSEGRRPAWSHLVATSESFAATPPGVRGDFVRAMAEFDFGEALAGVSLPVVVIAGTRDTLTPYSANRRIAEAIPGARLETVSGAGHQLVFEAPDRLAEVLLEVSAAAD
ncbi:MAG: alpha/beta fold hydrolase, partial [Acidimicrobiaceae bacterium]|nr:alpha/beta fold hydrolase [Acidimicrobiaceae bacterium]